jgi:hypothetical protein
VRFHRRFLVEATRAPSLVVVRGWRRNDWCGSGCERAYIGYELVDVSGDLLMRATNPLHPSLDALDLRGAFFAIPGRAEGWKGLSNEGGVHWPRTSVPSRPNGRCCK